MDRVKEYETSTDETIKTKIDKINNEETSSLEEDESDPDNEEDENIPLEYDNNGRPKIFKINQSNKNQVFQSKIMKKV